MSDDLIKLNISGREPSRDLTEIPSNRTEDLLHEAVKAAISGAPLLGPLAAKAFEIIIAPPLARRKDEWIQDIAIRLVQLEQNDPTKLEALASNEVFLSTFAQAAQAAIRTHEKEKLEALRNAVINSTSPGAPDESMQAMFIAFVDDFTVWHLRILQFADDPALWINKHNFQFGGMVAGKLANILEHIFEDLRDKREFYDQVWRDLFSRGLVSIDSLHLQMYKQDLLLRRTSPFGRPSVSRIHHHTFQLAVSGPSCGLPKIYLLRPDKALIQLTDVRTIRIIGVGFSVTLVDILSKCCK
jgi:hypothetical protein